MSHGDEDTPKTEMEGLFALLSQMLGESELGNRQASSESVFGLEMVPVCSLVVDRWVGTPKTVESAEGRARSFGPIQTGPN